MVAYVGAATVSEPLRAGTFEVAMCDSDMLLTNGKMFCNALNEPDAATHVPGAVSIGNIANSIGVKSTFAR